MKWQKLIKDVCGTGLSVANVARKANAGVSTIADLASGATKEPRYSLGVRLIELHRETVPAIEYDESRIDVISCNGGDGEHYSQAGKQ